ncbi:MAG: PD-(D/E)XK nuclease family protein, partial [Candidatus Peribacteraceae bacterium]|nr:PD-(D/E)XK nuclease family protein [Candidatus Peribacteraceae bacterium]
MPLSYSQLRLYQVCPRQYEFAVIKKLSRPITPAESFGSSVHNTLKKWGELEGRKQKKEVRGEQTTMFDEREHDTSPLSLLPSTLTELWHQTFSPDVYGTRVEADFARRRGEQIMEHFLQWWSQQPRTVLAVEKGFSLAIDGLTLTGRLDRVEQEADGIHVIDFKTSPPRNQKEADADLQLSIYAI